MIEFAEVAMSLAGALAVQKPEASPLPCRAMVLDASGVRAIESQAWDRLVADPLECNPWLSRAVVLAGLDTLEAESGFRALAFYRHGTEDLIGFVPYRVKGFGPASIGHPALNLYQVGGTPLMSREHGQVAMLGLFGTIAGSGGVPGHWVFPHARLDGAFMAMAQVKARRLGLGIGVAGAYDRPVLMRRAENFADHVASVIGKKRSKDIERNLRRLAQVGDVTFERAKDRDSVAGRIEDFLRIEASGWKGARGTAFLSRPDHARFARKAFTGEGASVDALLLNGEPIAVSVNLAAGSSLFTPKCAFDERYRSFGPGLILEYKVIESFFDDCRYETMDSCTTVDGHVISGLWGETRRMGTLVVGRSRHATRGICHAIDGAGRARSTLKSALGR